MRLLNNSDIDSLSRGNRDEREHILKEKFGISKEFMVYLYANKFFEQPASTKYHGSYECGLFEHSLDMAVVLDDLTHKLDLRWDKPSSPLIIGMFHDICKIDNYIKIENNGAISYEYNKDTLLKGHGDKSIQILSQFMQLTEEEVLCIRYHMGAYETEDWNFFDRAIKKYPNVLFTHTADMIASKIVRK